MQLSKTVLKLLKNITVMVGSDSSSGLSEFALELEDMKKRLDKPLRVAVVGVMKAGKSTLMNTILQEKILFTGTLETTYTVSWFKYGEKPALNIVYYNGTEEAAPFEELEKWTVRPADVEKHLLDEVEYVEIYYPNEILKTMELIDTPGLQSTHEKDARNTYNFLGQRLSEEADKVTAENASKAEAIIYAFSRSAAQTDADVLDAFKGESSNTSPVNAIGIFTQADRAWDVMRNPDANPLELVASANEKYKSQLKDKLYTVMPVSALPVEGACGLDDRSFDILKRLSGIDKADLLDSLSFAELFITDPADEKMPVSSEDRQYILKQFAQYGIFTATNALREGITREELPKYLYDRSGVGDAMELVLRHFGNRALLIKLDHMFRRLRQTAGKVKNAVGTDSAAKTVCTNIIEAIDTFREQEHSFCELDVLRSYYDGEFGFPDDNLEEQFLQITGEYGSNCEARLGFAGPVSIGDLKQETRERSKKWNGIANSIGTTVPLRKAAEVIVRSCNEMHYHLDMLSGY